MNGDEPTTQIPSDPSKTPTTTNGEPNLKSQDDKPQKTSTTKLPEFDADGVSLTEDNFAPYYDEYGNTCYIKRFTWRNRNKIQIQVLNYGARVISVILPDRNGHIEDVLLGFDDVTGYMFYEKFYFGAVIGRTSNIIKNSTFVIDHKRFNVTPNYGKHSFNGGYRSLDKVVWDTYIKGRKVIMSYISPHLTEGYPGDLLVRASFELSGKNEFKVSFEAQTTQPTCVDLSHLLYFNLAGHHTGPDEMYKHILTLNCNCFTPQVDKIPTGEIYNVLHSEYDFQIPKLLGKVIGITPKDGFDQNLCVNRGMYQNECFVGRILHPPSGRMMEVYSNQPGVQLNTANDFGYGNVLTFEEVRCEGETPKDDKTMLLYQKVHTKVIDLLKYDEQQNFSEMQQLIKQISGLKSKNDEGGLAKLKEQGLNLTVIQCEYLKRIRDILCENEETDDACLDLKEIINTVMEFVKVVPTAPSTARASKASSAGAIQPPRPSQEDRMSESSKIVPLQSPRSSNTQPSTARPKEVITTIPAYYKDFNQIRGKGRAIYKTHGAIALQTQNYPNAVNVKQFPNSILNPGEVYKHDVVYRFWIRAGNPAKWVRRNLIESKRKLSNK